MVDQAVSYECVAQQRDKAVAQVKPVKTEGSQAEVLHCSIRPGEALMPKEVVEQRYFDGQGGGSYRA